MQNQEYILSNYPLIYEMLNVGFAIKEVTSELNRVLGTKVSYREMLYLIKRVQKRSIHREYDKVVMVDGINDTADNGFNKFCINFRGLLITYKSASNLFNPKLVITSDSLETLSSQESLLYAKRILKLYYIPDVNLLEKQRKIYPNKPNIDLNACMDIIHINFNDEFNTMLSDLRKKYVHFITNNLQEKINAK